jgi:cytochrome o ubiquinol oxidase operon protein cyoD
MTENISNDVAPGDVEGDSANIRSDLLSYSTGFGIAILLTAASFTIAATHIVWGPAIPAALITLAIAQMGVHLVFFIHITTAPDNTNNILALAFGVLIVGLVIGGSVWIMQHLNANMMPMMRM